MHNDAFAAGQIVKNIKTGKLYRVMTYQPDPDRISLIRLERTEAGLIDATKNQFAVIKTANLAPA